MDDQSKNMKKLQISIKNNIVDGGPANYVPAHLSLGQYMIDSLRERCWDNRSVALINGETGQKLTYQQILQDSVNLATGLKKLGVTRGDTVAICSENSDEYISIAIGIICCGATVTTANVQYTKDEMTHVLNISSPKIIFCSEEAIKRNLNTLKSLPYIKKIVQVNGAPADKGVIPFSQIVSYANVDDYQPDEVQGWSDVVFILYSSGTTGLPKGVMITHLNALYAAINFKANYDPRSDERTLTLVPWYHAYGLMSTVNNLAVGKLIVYFNGFHPLKYLNAIQGHKLNVLYTVPPIVVFLAKAPLVEKYDMSSVTKVLCGAAPLTSETVKEALKRLPNCKGVLQGYGMTETSLTATQDLDDPNYPLKAGSGGVPLPGVKVKVVDLETKKRLGPHGKGEICIKGPVIMKGYAGDAAATKHIMDEEGYLRTGDIGYYDDDGYLFVVDRLKELIKYKGSQVPPAAVESVLLQHSAVAECGVAGAPDEAAGELTTAFVVLRPDAHATVKDIVEFANARLSPEKRLYGGVIFVNEIPKNPSGKILRRKLKEQLLKRKKISKL